MSKKNKKKNKQPGVAPFEKPELPERQSKKNKIISKITSEFYIPEVY